MAAWRELPRPVFPCQISLMKKKIENSFKTL